MGRFSLLQNYFFSFHYFRARLTAQAAMESAWMKSLKGKSLSRSAGTEINKTRLADFIERRKTNVSDAKTVTTSFRKDNK